MTPIKSRNEVLGRIENSNKRLVDEAIKDINKVLDSATSFPVRIPLTARIEINSILIKTLEMVGWKPLGPPKLTEESNWIEVQ